MLLSESAKQLNASTNGRYEGQDFENALAGSQDQHVDVARGRSILAIRWRLGLYNR